MDYRTWKLRARNNKCSFQVPSVFFLNDVNLIPLRRDVEPRIFVEKALKGARLNKLKERSISKIRTTVLADIDRILKDKFIHFDRLEIAFLLNVFYSLTDYKVRPLGKSELKNFLYLTLDITNTTVISGLYRAGVKLSQGGNSKSWGVLDGPAFVKLMSILLRGSIEERAMISFYIIDEDDDGILSPKSELSHSLRSTFDPHISASAPDIDPEEPSRDTLRYLIRKMGISMDGGLAMDDFINVCLTSPWFIDGILPTLPSELHNYAFQSFISQVPKLPLIDNSKSKSEGTVRK
ncbi:hypothetical protein Aperf_G00000031997 [Anoplocephala perfoliata]